LEADAADVTIRGTINCVAEGHIVGRHRFGDGAGRGTHVEKPAGHLLARADLGKRSILIGIQVNLKSLFVGADLHFRVHA